MKTNESATMGPLYTRRDTLEHVRARSIRSRGQSADRCMSLIFEGMVNLEWKHRKKTKADRPIPARWEVHGE